MKKQLLLFALMLLPMVASAYDIAVENSDGVTIYYNYINEGTELEVTSDYYYTGNIVIPEEVTYMNRTRKVTSIGSSAFYNSSSLTSVTIPNSVTSIGEKAFYDCSKLTSVTIPNSVTSIGSGAFIYCSSLTSVTIGNSVTSIGSYAFSQCSGLTSVSIGNSVTSIGSYAFSKCSGLTSVTIPNSVTSIGSRAFYNCSSLTSVTIGNSVTSIGSSAFCECSGLTSVTIGNSVISIGSYAFGSCSGLSSVSIPNSVMSIGENAFSGCSGLTSMTIPNSVTIIENYAFSGCSGLTSVSIGNSVSKIGRYAFDGCSGLTSVTIPPSVTGIGLYAFNCENISKVVSLIENPFTIPNYTSSTSIDLRRVNPISYASNSSNSPVFSQNTLMNADLFVPKGTIDKYKATDGWKDFVFIQEGDGGGGSSEPITIETCATPTISYANGKLTFNCATEGAVCHSSITDTDINSYSTNEVELTATYTISVYAAKAGCYNSETATATLCWIDATPKTEGITNSIANIPAQAVMIKNNGNILTIQGAEEGTPVNVYGIDGTQQGSATSQNGYAEVITSLNAGDIAIIKIGQKTVKVVMK